MNKTFSYDKKKDDLSEKLSIKIKNGISGYKGQFCFEQLKGSDTTKTFLSLVFYGENEISLMKMLITHSKSYLEQLGINSTEFAENIWASFQECYSGGVAHAVPLYPERKRGGVY